MPKINITQIPRINSTKGGRSLDTKDFESIRIKIDSKYIKSQVKGSITQNYVNNVTTVLEKTAKMFEKILSVQRGERIELQPSNGSFCWVPAEQIESTTITDADIVIFPEIASSQDLGDAEAAASFCALESKTQRPVAGLIRVSSSYDFSKKNSEKYLQMLMFHELTHVLVFHDQLYSRFQGLNGASVTGEEKINGVTRTLIKTPKVVELAKKHFGCNEITGVEVEDQGGTGTAGSHWEARTMLGDYMIGTDYGEITLSEISLGLFEDSGWYKVKYYTGGLFRHGKGKGCDFIKTKCIQGGKSISNNDFCSVGSQTRCFSGRTGRGFCLLSKGFSQGDIPAAYQYFSSSQIGGFMPADYCPVTYSTRDEDTYYSSSCGYGTSENKLDKIGEKSVCVISTLGESKEEKADAVCLETDCSNGKLTLKVGQTSVECPKEGGTLNVTGYSGQLYCPDYNLVCTAKDDKYCNNLIDCIDKEATYNEDSFNYDYTPENSQLESTSSGNLIYVSKLLFLFVFVFLV